MFGALMLLLSAQTADAGVVVWLEAEVPDEKIVTRADNKTGGTQHLAHHWLAFPPQPEREEDSVQYDKLRQAVADGKRRWTEFEVEYGIAQELDEILGAVDIIRDDRDRDDIVDARLFQGAAVHIAFEPDEWINGERAAPFRVDGVGDAYNRPWLEALALDAERQYTRSDVADGASFPALQKAIEQLSMRATGTLAVPQLPEGSVLYLNGSPVDSGAIAIPLFPGNHYAHIVRGDVYAGRAVFDVQEGDTVQMPVVVDDAEREKARKQVLQETTTGFPEDVKTALNDIARHMKGEIFVAAVEENKVVVLPYAAGAELLEQRPVTVLGVGEIGGGVVASSLFDNANGSLLTAPAVIGGIGLELGIYNGAIAGGLDLAFTPAQSITHANGAEDENIDTAVLAMPWGGIGGYILRPTGTTPTFLILATMGWDAPAHLSYGGRMALGIPIDDTGTFFRASLGGKAAPKSMWETDDPMYTFFLRFGLAGLF